MKKLNQLLVAIVMMAITNPTFSQVTRLGHTGFVTDFVGWNATQNFPLQLRHNGSFPINVLTTNVFRMKINPTISYTVNNLLPAQARNGFVLIGNDGFSNQSGLTLAANNFGPYSLLHLNGEGTFVEDFGYRNWMRTGITFTGNRDLSYFGLRKLSTTPTEEDITETTIAWADNDGLNNFTSDDLQFRFLTGSSTTVNNLATAPNDLDGLHIARFTSSGRIGFGNTFGLNATGMTPSVPYVAPQNLLHMSLSGNQPVFLQITNRDDAGGTSGTGETANDGLYLGLPTTAANNKPGIFSNRENDRLLFRTNDLSTNNDGERMRIMHTGALNAGVTFPGTLAENFTRVSISHNPANPVTRPMSLLHLGYNVDNPTTNDGWRNWMDVGTFMSRATDHLYVGMKNESNGSDAVLGWGDNNLSDGAGPDNFRMIFTTPLGVGLGPSNGANGVEGLRMTPTILQGINTGIGGDPAANQYVGGSQNPTATLEVNAWGGGNNTSGLRFTNLNSAATPGANPGAGVLSVNPSGDVIYVDANTAPAIGNYCPDAQAPLQDHFEVPLNGLSYSFTAQQGSNDASTVNIGNVACGTQISARLFVTQSEPMPNQNAHAAIFAQTDATNLPALTEQYGVAGLILASNSFQHAGVYGVSLSANNDIFNANTLGIGVHGTAGGNDLNWGVLGKCVDNNAYTNIGVYGEASGASTNNYAGFFDGDVYINGGGWINGLPIVTSDKRFKANIKPIPDALDIINKLKPSTYYMDTLNPYGIKFANTKQYGLIAQEVEQFLPELVHSTTKPEKYDSTGKTISNAVTYKGVEYNAFIGIIIAAMQEQQGQIHEKDSLLIVLNDRLTRLEDCINRLNLCNNGANYRTIANPSSTGDETLGNQTKTTAQNVKLSDPQSIVLNQNVPNPFAEKTGISYFLPKSVKSAKIIFHNQEGKFVNSVELTERGNGTINVYADDLSSGIYTYTLIADDKVIDTKKMVKD